MAEDAATAQRPRTDGANRLGACIEQFRVAGCTAVPDQEVYKTLAGVGTEGKRNTGQRACDETAA